MREVKSVKSMAFDLAVTTVIAIVVLVAVLFAASLADVRRDECVGCCGEAGR